jgi:tRNA(Ile)-lysidine synthase
MPLKLSASPFTRRIDRSVADYVRRRDCLEPGETVIAAVSGGPDSTALLLILSRIAEELQFEIGAGHFDHQLRSRSEAEGDRRFVAALCKALRVPLATGQGDASARAKRQQESIEDAARKLRYHFLGEEAREAEATAVVTGHTLDDRAETVLLHALRGSGLSGLAAMPPRSSWPFGGGPAIARPIVELRREETERYCRESGVEARRDPTNDLPIALRNRVRNELMPSLREFNPRVAEALARLADAAATDEDFIDRVAKRDWSALASATRERVVFPREAFAGFHPAIQARLVMRAAERVGGEASPAASHLSNIVAALEKQTSRVSLPGGLVCSIGRQRITISRAGGKARERSPEVTLTVPGKTSWGAWTLTAREAKGALPDQIGKHEAYVAAAGVRGQLRVRSRRPGDRLRPLGMRGEKKVQDVLTDAKVPAEERDEVPIVCDDEGVLWVVGQRLAARAAVRRKGPMVHVSAKRARRR